jgi:hypothetical protein
MQSKKPELNTALNQPIKQKELSKQKPSINKKSWKKKTVHGKPSAQAQKIKTESLKKKIKPRKEILFKKPFLSQKNLVVKKESATKKKKLFMKNKSLFLDLIKIQAYYGDTPIRNHSSQDAFVYAYRNDYSLYNLHTSLANFKRALQFLQKQKPENLVFVGCPAACKEKTALLFQSLKIPFFPSSEWVPGFISKKAYNTSKVLILYDIFTNHGAKSEALKAGYPIVSFFSIHGNVNGIDFPINLNLDNSGLWYYNLWKTYFLITSLLPLSHPIFKKKTKPKKTPSLKRNSSKKKGFSQTKNFMQKKINSSQKA